MKRSVAAILALTLGTIATFAPCLAANDQQSVAGMLTQSAYAWNHGDLDTFMRGYEDSPATVYVSAKGVIHGYTAIRAHYAANYGKSGMGILSFSGLSVRSLGTEYAVVVAHWHLAMTGGAHPTGVFSLLLHRSPSGWHIIEDCTP
jgi:hypothetical protein